MAIVDLTRVTPYTDQAELVGRAQQQTSAQLQNAFANISRNIQTGQARRQALNERNQQLRDREYALANEETGKLTQAHTNNKFTDMQLQQVGRQFKQEFYDAVKTYEASDKSDEARQAFEEAKSQSLGSARTISGSLEALGTSMDAFKQQMKNGGISDGMDPAVRSFFADLNSPDISPEQFQIVKDPETGNLKYQGETTDGYPVDFFLEDIANGDNQFAPVPKANMPDVVQNLTKGLSAAVKQEERDWGVVEVTDWSSMGEVLNGRIDQLLDGDENFRGLAAGLGYGYEELQKASAGEPFEDADGRVIDSEDALRSAMKQELMEQIEMFTPHQEKTVAGQDPNSAVQREYERKQLEAKAVDTVTQTQGAILDNNFDAYVNKPATIKGLKGNIANVDHKNGVVTVTVRSGQKGGSKQSFDTTDPRQATQLYSILNNVDYATAALGVQKLNRIEQDLNDIAL